MMMESRREEFNKIVEMYKKYLALYKFFNHGKFVGATPFRDFYWVHHYLYKHKVKIRT
ncbi:MAG: hypothetical protein HYW48_06785 [Deltaproteobacteria bacterium]|nr:hypothetical protein [Deltaproteobacteria bacterium]